MALMNRGYNDPDAAFADSFRPKQKVPVAPAPVAAPAPPPPPAFTYKPPSLGGYDEYMEAQRVAFTPQLLKAGSSGINEGGDWVVPDTYTQYDPEASRKNYMNQLYSEMGVSPELGNMFEQIYGYRGAKESLAKSIGYTGRTGVQGPDVSGGTNEGGYEGFTPTEVISPEFAQALTGYSFQPSIQGNDPAVDVYKPNGEKLGQYRIGDSPGRMMQFMRVAIPALVTGGFGLAAAPLVLGAGAGAAATAATSGAIGSGLNTAIQGGDLEDIIKSGLTAAATAGASNFINTGLTSLPWMKEGIDYTRATIQDILQGAPEFLVDTVSGLPRNAVQGAARGLIKGDVVGGVTDAVLGQIVQDVAPSLGLTVSQARAGAKALRDNDYKALALSVGPDLVKQFAGSVQDAIRQQGIEQAYNDPSRALDVLPSSGADFDLDAFLSTMPGYDSTYYGQKPAWEEDFTSGGYDSDFNYGADTSDLSTSDIGVGGAFADYTPAAEQVVITGQKPTAPPLGGGSPTAPPLGGGSTTTPTTPSKEIDINSLLNLLGGGGQEPVLSQVLAQMPKFGVEKELSPTLYAQRQSKRKGKMSPQEQQLTALIEELKNRG